MHLRALFFVALGLLSLPRPAHAGSLVPVSMETGLAAMAIVVVAIFFGIFNGEFGRGDMVLALGAGLILLALIPGGLATILSLVGLILLVVVLVFAVPVILRAIVNARHNRPPRRQNYRPNNYGNGDGNHGGGCIPPRNDPPKGRPIPPNF
ncbi:MAG: hypothetical protein KQJ78_25920 [Deltaproteobacteria bacterium]|nr:hypothetical protein [Deltaproteobacteria bacterium]